MATQNLVHGGDTGRWDQAIYAFLAEKERRSGSMRTVRAYSGMLYRFFGTLGKPPDKVTAPEVFGYAHGTGPSGKKPSSVTGCPASAGIDLHQARHFPPLLRLPRQRGDRPVA